MLDVKEGILPIKYDSIAHQLWADRCSK